MGQRRGCGLTADQLRERGFHFFPDSRAGHILTRGVLVRGGDIRMSGECHRHADTEFVNRVGDRGSTELVKGESSFQAGALGSVLQELNQVVVHVARSSRWESSRVIVAVFLALHQFLHEVFRQRLFALLPCFRLPALSVDNDVWLRLHVEAACL